jgi:hypothetical protein
MKRPRQGGNMTLARHALDIAMAAGSASAQTWPNTSIRPGEPSPGELVDLIIRHVAEPFAQTIVVDKAGMGGCSARPKSHARRSTPARKGPAPTPSGNCSAAFMVWRYTGIDKMKKLVGPHSITLPEQVS